MPAGLSVRVFWAKYSLHLDGEYSGHRLRGCHAGPEPRPRPGPLSRERSPAPSRDARAPGLLLGLSSFAEMCRSCRELNERNGSFPCWPLSSKLASAASLLGRAMRSAARVHVRVCTPACVCPSPGRRGVGPRQPRGGRVREPPGRRDQASCWARVLLPVNGAHPWYPASPRAGRDLAEKRALRGERGPRPGVRLGLATAGPSRPGLCVAPGPLAQGQLSLSRGRGRKFSFESLLEPAARRVRVTFPALPGPRHHGTGEWRRPPEAVQGQPKAGAPEPSGLGASLARAEP